MNKNTPDADAKKVKYIASILYLLVFTFIVVGSYINQPPPSIDPKNEMIIPD